MSNFTKPTLEQEFRLFWDRCYPNVETETDQYIEVRQSFYCGALIVILLTSEASHELSNQQAHQYLHDIAMEAQRYALTRIQEMKAEDRIKDAGKG